MKKNKKVASTPPMSLEEKVDKLASFVDVMATTTLKGFQSPGVANKAGGDASLFPNTTGYHGPHGAFAYPGISRDVLNAAVMPELGLISRLPVRASTELNPLHAIITGFTAPSGSNPTAICEPCSVPGNIKMGTITTYFGKFCMSTRTVNLEAPWGAKINRGEFRDFNLLGGMTMPDGNAAAPLLPGQRGVADALNSDAAMIEWEFMIGWTQKHGRLLYTGNRSNSHVDPTTGDLTYGEPDGLDVLINTGYQDAITGVAMPATDSLIRNWSKNVAADPVGLVRELTYENRYFDSLASMSGVAPITQAFVMPRMLFYELTDIWPCAYMTYRCTLIGNTNQRVINVADQTRMTEEMRNGNYLLIDGKKIPVIVDDAIIESGTNGTFTADIYTVPLTILGGRPVLYVEHFDYRNQYHEEMRNLFAVANKAEASPDGRFFYVRRESGACASIDVFERPRYVLDAPWLAGRLLDVSYTPPIAVRSGWVGDPRFYNGGIYEGTWSPSFYPPGDY